MTAIAAPKSHLANVLEGLALTAVLQAVPIYASAALMLKLMHSDLAGSSRALTTVIIATMLYALLVPLLGRRFPKRFEKAYEPLFFDATLPLAEKVAGWRTRPYVSVQLVATMIMLSILAIAVVSAG